MSLQIKRTLEISSIRNEKMIYLFIIIKFPHNKDKETLKAPRDYLNALARE
jgi:hypothetical protein